MTMQISHSFVSVKPDGLDASQVQPSHWNADHTITLTGPALFGRTISGSGGASEITLGDNLSFVNNTLVAAGGSGGGSAVSSIIPQNLGEAASGTSVSASRDDHVHNMPTAVDIGAASVLHGHTIANITDLQTALTNLQSAIETKTDIASVNSAIQAVVGAAPLALNTLAELSAALGNDANYATTVTTALGNKANAVHLHAFADVTGLSTALSGKASTIHNHVSSDITDLATSLELAGIIPQVMSSPASDGVVGTELVPVINNGVLEAATVNQLLSMLNVMVAIKDSNGAFTGMSMPGGGPLNDLIVIGSAEPVNTDGRPNGTIYIKAG